MDETVRSEGKVYGENRTAQPVSGRGLHFQQRDRPERNGGPAALIEIQGVPADPVTFIQPDLTEFIGP